MIKKNQIIYKTNQQGKLFQYEVINISEELNSAKVKNLSSGGIRTLTISELASYSLVVPQFKSIANIVNTDPVPLIQH